MAVEQTHDSRQGEFLSTHWSIVFRARDRGEPGAEEALTWLCERYWFPIYGYVRKRGYPVADAQDLTQGFLVSLIERNALQVAEPRRGRFRSFLLGCLQHYLANVRAATHALKRGGGHRQIPFNGPVDESRLGLEHADSLSPERYFERQWALSLLRMTLDRLRGEYHQAGRGRAFELLLPTLTAPKEGVGYAAIARELGCSEAAARQAAYRLRQRYREILREEIARTVDDPAAIDDEIRDLFAALGAG